MRITFYGAAGEVTGSKHLIQTSKSNLLLDCGMHQGRRKEADLKNRQFPIDSSKVNAAILSHGHLDHCGMLPILVKNGFKGSIYATPATSEIAGLILQDSARIQEQDAEYVNRHLENEMEPVEPIYTEEEAKAVIPFFKETEYFRDKPHWTPATKDAKFRFLDAGHILGSSMIEVSASENGKNYLIGFSGDLGKQGNPLLKDPEPFRDHLDALILESTYGSRVHEPTEHAVKTLEAEVKEAVAKRSKIIIPAFAIGRTQHLIYELHKLTDSGRIPRIPIFVDSPLGIDVTDVFKRHQHNFNDSADDGFGKPNEYPLAFKNLQYVETVEASKALNQRRGPFIVIASSGMSEGGRIVHHLDQHIGDKKTTIIITGYQAENTLGRKILDGQSPVKIYGKPHTVRAKIVYMPEFSAHADKHGLIQFLKSIPLPKRIFLVHGELEQSEDLKQNILRYFNNIQVDIPLLGQTFEV